MNHLMLDIETMGSESYSCIVSIGALEFDIESGNTGREFYVNVDLQSCLDIGLEVSAKTILWWMQQSENARKDFVNRKLFPIKEALEELSKFINKDYEVWGNSARFDCGLIQNAYKKANLPLPWKYYKERCVRTLLSFAPEIKAKCTFNGTAHNALSDCYYQVEYCSQIWSFLKNKKNG